MNARFFSIALALPLLAGCTVTDDRVAGLLSDPGRYVNYSCPQIVVTLRTSIERQRELEQLTAKAGNDAGGRLVSATTYRPEYLALRGDVNDLRRTAAGKQCDLSKVEVTASPPRAAPAAKRTKPQARTPAR
jgi:hypothetical protein